MLTRRRFLTVTAEASAGLAFFPAGCARVMPSWTGELLNDVHSQLNATRVSQVVAVDSVAALRAALTRARRDGRAVSIAGGRHSMGGQQFGADTVLIDTRPMRRVINLNRENGLVEVEAGIHWPELVESLVAAQTGHATPWGIIQKQTGADRLSLGGALGSNIHGRGLRLTPLIGDVEAFTLMDADGTLSACSRERNLELFRLAIGGYGLFGVITAVTLRLMPRTKLERVVELIDVEDLMSAFTRRIDDGFLFGDCQFSIDAPSEGFLRRGVFSCYRPLPADTPMPSVYKELSANRWRELYYLAHADTARAFEAYSSYYLSTSGQRYWSDTHQLSVYLDDYHREVDQRLGSRTKGSEMITEVYVPRETLPRFMAALRQDFREHGVQVIYGTIRLIEPDRESFLAWAKQPWVCIVMNLHVVRNREGIEKSAEDFRRVIDRAIEHGGSYFLTYHRWATKRQVAACYPQMVEFLRLKRTYDPAEVFQSDWYRHYKAMFAGEA